MATLAIAIKFERMISDDELIFFGQLFFLFFQMTAELYFFYRMAFEADQMMVMLVRNLIIGRAGNSILEDKIILR